YATVDLNLPPALSDEDLGAFWQAMSDEWARLEVAVVAGHTGRYPGGGGSVIGGATLIGVGDEGRYLAPAMAAPGDRVIVTQGCAIEAAARLPLAREARAACATWGDIDPLWTLSEGTLIATVRPAFASAVLGSLADQGIAAAEVGEVLAGSGQLWLTAPDGTVRTLREP